MNGKPTVKAGQEMIRQSRREIPQPWPHSFWVKVEVGPDCWEWKGKRTVGYGHIWYPADHSMRLAHRLSFEMAYGPIPADLTIDHLCQNRACVNPLHMEVVSRGENTLRGNSPAAINSRKKQCQRGHWFTPENTGVDRGGRYCRVCNRQWQREYRAKKRAAA